MAGSFLPHTLASTHTVWLFRLYLAICFRVCVCGGGFNDLTVQLLRDWGLFGLVSFFCWSLSWVWIREERVAAGQEMYYKEDTLEKKMATVGCQGLLVDKIRNPKSRKNRGLLLGELLQWVPILERRSPNNYHQETRPQKKALFHIMVRGATEVIPKAMPSLQRGSMFLLGESTDIYIGDHCMGVVHSERVQCKVMHNSKDG